ncbi:hypothetical protein GCM10022386_16070 [Flavobacterium cheonhonense]|uniref:VanZ-like domain-containing protein n=1 Tax=Flavobacterium cheonhonense TaxID=706185 RepID=A0ABP7TX73_9FLAO
MPDGLWVYSFSALLYLIWSENFRWLTKILFVPLVVLCVMEFLQYLKIISGTFDYNDVLTSLIMYSLFCINIKFYKSEKKIENY